MNTDSAKIKVWLREKLDAKGHGAKGELARFMNISPSAISRMISDKPGREDRMIEAAELLAMERFFGERVPVGDDNQDSHEMAAPDDGLPIVRRVRVYGEVAAGVWQEEEIWDVEKYDSIPVVPGRYERLDQRAFLVRGPSVDKKRIYDGDFVITVRYWEARDAVVDGDLVVVSRRKGDLTERTVKEVLVHPDRVELWPRSSDPRFQTPIVIIKNDAAFEDVSIEITDLVIGTYRPLV